MKISQHRIKQKCWEIFFVNRVRMQIECTDDLLPGNKRAPVGIAVLDTGIANHPDFKSRIIDFYDFINKKQYIYDDSGHGTHVAGCIGGDGRMSGGKYRGIHPKCNFVVGKVLNEYGEGSLKDMISGLEWVFGRAEKYNIRVVNISVGVTDTEEKELFKTMLELVEEAWRRNILIVCAAGNKGPKPMTISPLGIGNHVISVGCHDGDYFKNKEGTCEIYSGRGPTPFAIKKPDLVAPGTDIISCNAGFRAGNRRNPIPYIKKSGTSMSTPIVAGAAALLIQKNGNMECEEIKRRLVYSAVDLKEPWTKQGWGMLNVKRLLEV